MPARAANRGRNTTADRAFDVLLLFDDRRPVLSAAAVSALLGMTRSTTYRYLQTLRSYGLVEEDEVRGGFRVGPRVYQLARVARQGLGLPEIALPHLRELAARTHELALLTRRWGDTVVCVERVESDQAVSLSRDRGMSRGAHAGASAKILLAFSSPEELERYFSTATLTRYTERTTVDPNLLRTQLRQIRDQGYAITESEIDDGVTSVAAPIFRPDGRVAAGLAIAGPTFRFDATTLPAMIKSVRDVADAISAELRELDS